MEIEQINNKKNGVFKAVENNTLAGQMTYVWAGDSKIIIDHTEVNPDYTGKGVGQQLVMQAVNFARENSLKIMPLCPFANSVFQKMPELNDVKF